MDLNSTNWDLKIIIRSEGTEVVKNTEGNKKINGSSYF